MQIAALFADYDGTLAPLRVSRAESKVPKDLQMVLRMLASRVPLGIVTAKDFDFISPRTPFAAGWGCVSGLEVRVSDGRVWTRRGLRPMDEAVRLGASAQRKGVYAEVKRGSRGQVLGVSIDWSENPGQGKTMLSGVRRASNRGLAVVHDGYSEYVDILAGTPDKGRAVKVLNRLLGVNGTAMFIGDSPLDNTAFQEAGIAVGVAHGQPLEGMECRFVVEQSELAGFLRSLSDRGMEFAPSLHGVRRKED